MTVKELIKQLKQFGPDKRVVIYVGNMVIEPTARPYREDKYSNNYMTRVEDGDVALVRRDGIYVD